MYLVYFKEVFGDRLMVGQRPLKPLIGVRIPVPKPILSIRIICYNNLVMKKPILYAFVATVYIVFIVSVVNFTKYFSLKESILMPMTMLGLFVLSAAIMGFLFLSEPLTLYLDGQKREAFLFFGKIVGFFACFVVLLSILILVF